MVDSDSLYVRWRLDCSDRVGIVTGYKISYCPTVSDVDTSDCLEEEKSILTEADASTIWVPNLTPWTYYKVGVAVLTRAGESEMSDYLVNRTEPAKPGSAPERLRLQLASKNSIRLSWQPPARPNAPITSYQVKYGYVDFPGQTASETFKVEDGERSAVVSQLASNAEYEIQVRACTDLPDRGESLCGDQWATAKVVTGVGGEFKLSFFFILIEFLTMFLF